MTNVAWSVTDTGGNATSCAFTVTVTDEQLPGITCPGPVTVTCAGQVPAVNLAAVSAADNCGAPTISHDGDATNNQTCTNRKTITWRATDACGNTTAATQTIQVSDTGAPVFVTVPGPLTVECNQPVPPLVNPTASDVCGGYVQITFLGNVPTGNGCENSYTITRTWRAQDLQLQISLRKAGAAAGIYTVSVRSARGVVATRVVLVE